ncbi:hypothetical protein [Deinococcus sp. QL22]|uniref:hypothetical protein n=1 Tax=Deinococcus sp. QL22 TaxID=2939437 RepID=UPI0020173B12|nr:hypothetical protein [Deinococcus sp. QL22]UQN08039.1 hypothetical protein M1R55_18275 [Deinococcus sp. QL22]
MADERPCQVEFESRWAANPDVAQGRRVIVDWSTPGAGAPELLALPLAGRIEFPAFALDTL